MDKHSLELEYRKGWASRASIEFWGNSYRVDIRFEATRDEGLTGEQIQQFDRIINLRESDMAKIEGRIGEFYGDRLAVKETVVPVEFYIPREGRSRMRFKSLLDNGIESLIEDDFKVELITY